MVFPHATLYKYWQWVLKMYSKKKKKKNPSDFVCTLCGDQADPFARSDLFVRSCTRAPHFELSVHPLCSHQTRCCPPLIGCIMMIMSKRTPHAAFLPLTMVTEGRPLVSSCWSPECHLSLGRWKRHSGFTHNHGEVQGHCLNLLIRWYSELMFLYKSMNGLYPCLLMKNTLFKISQGKMNRRWTELLINRFNRIP